MMNLRVAAFGKLRTLLDVVPGVSGWHLVDAAGRRGEP